MSGSLIAQVLPELDGMVLASIRGSGAPHRQPATRRFGSVAYARAWVEAEARAINAPLIWETLLDLR